MGEVIGYVVIEYNQASHLPGLPHPGILHLDRADAAADMDHLIDENARVGRRERYVVAAVIELEDTDA